MSLAKIIKILKNFSIGPAPTDDPIEDILVIAMGCRRWPRFVLKKDYLYWTGNSWENSVHYALLYASNRLAYQDRQTIANTLKN